MQVLGVQERHELRVRDEVAPGEGAQLAQAVLRRQVAQLELLLLAADVLVRRLEHGEIQTFLVAEVVVQHPLVGLRVLRDPVDAGASEPVRGELVGGGPEDRCPRPVGVAHGGLRRAQSRAGGEGGVAGIAQW